MNNLPNPSVPIKQLAVVHNLLVKAKGEEKAKTAGGYQQ